MIPKITHSDNIAQTVFYNLKEDKGYLLEHDLASDDPNKWIETFEYLNRMYVQEQVKSGSKGRSLENPLMHLSLNLAPGEHLDDDKFTDITKEFLSDLGYENCNYLIVRHTDKEPEREHVHAIVSRISYDGELINDSFEHVRASRICRELEKRHGLQEIKSTRKDSNISLEELNADKFRDEVLSKPYIKLAIENAMKGPGGGKVSTEIFINKLMEENVSVNFNVGKTANGIRGISFMHEGNVFKGSSLGKPYSWNKLSPRIDFNMDRDRDVILASNAMINGENSAKRISEIIEVSKGFVEETDKEKLEKVIENVEKGALIVGALKRDLEKGNIDITKLSLDDYIHHKVDVMSLLRVSEAQVEKVGSDSIKAKSILNDFFKNDPSGLIEEYSDLMKSIITTPKGLQDFYKLHDANKGGEVKDHIDLLVENHVSNFNEKADETLSILKKSFPEALLQNDKSLFKDISKDSGYAYSNLMGLYQFKSAIENKMIKPGEISMGEYLNFKNDNSSFFQLNQSGKEIVSHKAEDARQFILSKKNLWGDSKFIDENISLLKMKFNTLQNFEAIKLDVDKNPEKFKNFVDKQIKIESVDYEARLLNDEKQIKKADDSVNIDIPRLLDLAKENQFDWKLPSALSQYRSGLEKKIIDSTKIPFNEFLDRKMASFSVIKMDEAEKENFRSNSSQSKSTLLKQIVDLQLDSEVEKMAKSLNFTPTDIKDLSSLSNENDIESKISGINNFVTKNFEFHKVDFLTGLNFDLKKLASHEDVIVSKDLYNDITAFSDSNKYDWKMKSIINDYRIGAKNGLIDFERVDFGSFVKGKIDRFEDFDIDKESTEIKKSNISRLNEDLKNLGANSDTKPNWKIDEQSITQKDVISFNNILEKDISQVEKIKEIDFNFNQLKALSKSYYSVSIFSLLQRVDNLSNIQFDKEDKSKILELMQDDKEIWKVGASLKDLEKVGVKGYFENTNVTAMDYFKSKMANYKFFELNSDEKSLVADKSEHIKSSLEEKIKEWPESTREKYQSILNSINFKENVFRKFDKLIKEEGKDLGPQIKDFIDKEFEIQKVNFKNRFNELSNRIEKNGDFTLDEKQKKELVQLAEKDNYSFKTISFLDNYSQALSLKGLDKNIVPVMDFVKDNFDKTAFFSLNKEQRNELNDRSINVKESVLLQLSSKENMDIDSYSKKLESISFGTTVLTKLEGILLSENDNKESKLKTEVNKYWEIHKVEALTRFDKLSEKFEGKLNLDEKIQMKNLLIAESFSSRVLTGMNNYFSHINNENLDSGKVDLNSFVSDYMESSEYFKLQDFEKKEFRDVANRIGEKLFSEFSKFSDFINSKEYDIFQNLVLKPKGVREFNAISMITDPIEKAEAVKGFVAKEVALHECNFKSRFKDIAGRINLHPDIFLTTKDEKELLDYTKGLNYDWRVIQAFSNLENRLDDGEIIKVDKESLKKLFDDALSHEPGFRQGQFTEQNTSMLSNVINSISNELMGIHYLVEKDMGAAYKQDGQSRRIKRDSKGKRTDPEQNQSKEADNNANLDI